MFLRYRVLVNSVCQQHLVLIRVTSGSPKCVLFQSISSVNVQTEQNQFRRHIYSKLGPSGKAD